MDEGKGVLEQDDRELDGILAKKAGGRGRLRKEAEKEGGEFAALFEGQTDAQKAWGRLIGKLMVAKSNEAVEQAFDWWAMEYNKGIALVNAERAVAFFHAVGSLGVDDAHYRILRRMYVKANTNE